MNATGKASNQQIKNAEKKQVAKTQAKKPPVKTAAIKKQAAQPRAGGLRISFKPADLGKTTDKNMAAQVLIAQTVHTHHLFFNWTMIYISL